MKIRNLKTEEPFKSLSRNDKRALSVIENDMEKYGYDQSKPIITWKEKNIVIDGHVRLQAAKNIGIADIPVYEATFADENEALAYAIHSKRDKRGFSDADILHLVPILDKIFSEERERFSITETMRPKPFDRQAFVGTMKGNASDGREEIRKELLDKDVPVDKTEEILRLDSDTLHKCRYILEKFEPREFEEIFEGTDTIAKYYKRVMNAEERLRKKNMEQDKRIKALIENKASDIPLVFRGKKRKERNKNNTRRIRTMDNLVLKTFPKLYKRTADMYEVRKAMEYYKAEGEQVFEAASSRPAIQRFLGSLFVNDFIALLECLDYKIEKPANIKIIKEIRKEAPPKEKRMPRWNISQVHEIGFVSKAERRAKQEASDKRFEKYFPEDKK